MQKHLLKLKKAFLKAPLERDTFYSKVYEKLPQVIKNDYEQSFETFIKQARFSLLICGAGVVLGGFTATMLPITSSVPSWQGTPYLFSCACGAIVWGLTSALAIDHCEDEWKHYRKAEEKCFEYFVNGEKSLER